VAAVAGVLVCLGTTVVLATADEHSVVTVTPHQTHGWSAAPPLADNRPGGTVSFVLDPNAPAGDGALQLTTNATTAAKAQYMHASTTPLARVSKLSYHTKQVSAPFAGADPAYQLVVCLNGVTTTGCKPNLAPTPASSFSTLVFEPYQNPQQAPVVPKVWQKWNVATGLFWSTRSVKCSNGIIAGSAGGPATYTLPAIKTACPDAVVIAYGVNIGTFNPSYVVRVDLFTFNGTTYDFELSERERGERERGEREREVRD
jgi:hypothetical protein